MSFLDRISFPIGPGIVAVSGGADSVALLRILAIRTPKPTVAHLNHQLRGAESDLDQRFVCDLAASLNLSVRTASIDVKKEAERRGMNLEAAAREVRYEWLQRIATEVGASWIATGHTADDQAETILHRLIRGSGIQGFRGIIRERYLAPGVLLSRPLLDVRRDELRDWLRSLPQDWREDASNADPAFTRNRIRHELLPLLHTFNPMIVDVLGRLAEQATEDHDEHAIRIGELFIRAELPRAGKVCVFNAELLRAESEADLRRLFRHLWDRECWPLRDMTMAHWHRLARFARGGKVSADLPAGIRARRRGSAFTIGP